MREAVFGLRTVHGYKLYRSGSVYFAGHKTVDRLRRVKLANRAMADSLVGLCESAFAEQIERALQQAKRLGSADYYEVRA